MRQSSCILLSVICAEGVGLGSRMARIPSHEESSGALSSGYQSHPPLSHITQAYNGLSHSFCSFPLSPS